MIELWHLSNIEWLQGLTPEEAERFRRAAGSKTYLPGTTIFTPTPRPNTVYILESGLVRIYRLGTAGAEVTLGFIHPGEVFGELTVFQDGAPRESFAEAAEACEVLSVSRGDFLEAIRAHEALVFEIATQIEGRFKQLESRVEDLVFRSARARLARMLLQLGEEFGSADGERIRIDAKLTHAELAKLVGTTRPTVSIALGELEDAGLVGRHEGRFVILDTEGLRKHSK